MMNILNKHFWILPFFNELSTDKGDYMHLLLVISESQWQIELYNWR